MQVGADEPSEAGASIIEGNLRINPIQPGQYNMTTTADCGGFTAFKAVTVNAFININGFLSDVLSTESIYNLIVTAMPGTRDAAIAGVYAAKTFSSNP